jgi:hypothetical protein
LGDDGWLTANVLKDFMAQPLPGSGHAGSHGAVQIGSSRTIVEIEFQHTGWYFNIFQPYFNQ